MSEGSMNRTQIQLTETQFRMLKERSVAENKSMAELIRVAVDAMLRDTAHISTDERKRRALAAAGLYSSGVTDLSADHDRYLSGAYGDDDLH
jgi:Arc/MetJ-type ribon-helix-helix transcriptional regulator